MADDLICVEVAYASPEKQILITLTLPAGSTAELAINSSDILQHFPDIDLSKQQIGIFGFSCAPDKLLLNGDRVEIYRPLLQDPMMARRNRAQS